MDVFLHCLDSTCSKIELITINTLFINIRRLVVRRVRIRSLATCETAFTDTPYDFQVTVKRPEAFSVASSFQIQSCSPGSFLNSSCKTRMDWKTLVRLKNKFKCCGGIKEFGKRLAAWRSKWEHRNSKRNFEIPREIRILILKPKAEFSTELNNLTERLMSLDCNLVWRTVACVIYDLISDTYII